MINKKGIYCYEENTHHVCFHCCKKKITVWRMIGYDEFGELWICLECWDQAMDISQAHPNKQAENEEL